MVVTYVNLVVVVVYGIYKKEGFSNLTGSNFTGTGFTGSTFVQVVVWNFRGEGTVGRITGSVTVVFVYEEGIIILIGLTFTASSLTGSAFLSFSTLVTFVTVLVVFYTFKGWYAVYFNGEKVYLLVY